MRKFNFRLLAAAALACVGIGAGVAYAQNLSTLGASDMVDAVRRDINGVGTHNAVPILTLFDGVGVGYGLGSGAAVTQLTARTTGVTLNNYSGAITLVSAAGSTVPASFTVTDSKIAATDTIIVVQKSGTDLYNIHVSNVAAGSFQITAFTTGGTTTEQPVFNYAIVRAKAS